MLKKTLRSVNIAMITAGTFVFLRLISLKVFAASTEWYENNSDIMQTNNMAMSAIRNIIWSITKVFVSLTNATESLYDTAFGFIDLTVNGTVNKFISAYKPAFVALLCLSLLYLGIILIMSHEKKPKIGVNIALCVLCVCCSTFLFQSMNDMAVAFKNGVNADTKAEQMAYDTVNSHMADLVRLNELHKSGGGLKAVNWSKKEEWGAGIKNKKTLGRVDLSEVLNYNSSKYTWHGDTQDILQHKLIINYDGTSEKPDIDEIKNGWFFNSADDTDIGNEFYYRYTFDWFSTWMELLALAIVYICMSYKCVRVAYELVVARLLAYLYSAELSGGEKIKKILVFIRDSYILLVVTAICIKIFHIINSYLESTSISGIPKSLIMLFVAFSVIDGPNLVEKLLGMDAGLKSSTARMLAIGRVSMGVGRHVSPKGVAQSVNNAKSGKISRGGVAGGIVGVTAGRMNESTGEREGGFAGKMKGTKVGDAVGGVKDKMGSRMRDESGGSFGGTAGAGGTGTGGAAGAAMASGPSAAGAGRSAMAGPAGASIKGDKGDKGDRGSAGQNAHSTDFMRSDQQRSQNKGGGDHSFMNAASQSRAGRSNSTGSAMPQRNTTSNSNVMDRSSREKKGDK